MVYGYKPMMNKDNSLSLLCLLKLVFSQLWTVQLSVGAGV